MKKIILISIIALSGCSLLPRDHDPVMFGDLVDVKISVDKLSCDDKNWNTTLDKVHTLKVYSELRKDPQATSISQLEEALGKARDSSNKLFCESVLKINKTRIDVIADAWKGR
jgi:hypothetical protein